jgi:hypothetical protein
MMRGVEPLVVDRERGAAVSGGRAPLSRLAGPRRQRGTDDLQFLFIMTYGRSGSTLLQGLLNAIPGYLIRGENRDAVYHLYRFHRTCTDEARRVARKDGRRRPVTHPFFGIDAFPADRSLEQVRELVTRTLLRPDPGTRVAGFKEIRWYQVDLAEYVAFLREVFPGARFLVNTRDHEAVLASAFWQDKPRDGRLQRAEKAILDVAADLGSAAHRVHYDDYVEDPGRLAAMFDWLGEPFDEARVREVMSVRHSY